MKRSRASARQTVVSAATTTPKRTAKAKSVALPGDPKELARLKLACLYGDEKLAAQLVKSGLGSVRQIAAMSAQTLLKRLDGKITRADERALQTMQTRARRMMTYVADQAIVTTLIDSPNGMWMPGRPGNKQPHLTCHCGCCGSIFSLKAYLFDLLDLLAHYWKVDLSTVETLLLRSFSE